MEVANRHDTLPILAKKFAKNLGIPTYHNDTIYNTIYRVLREPTWCAGVSTPSVNVAAHRRAFSSTPDRHDTLQVLFYKLGMRTGVVVDGSFAQQRDQLKQLLSLTCSSSPVTPSGPDPDAVDFILRAGLVDDTQVTAIYDLVDNLKGAGLWSKLLVLYPFVGGNAIAHSQNLLGSDFTITWVGGVTHDASGVTGDGSSGYGKTGFIAGSNVSSKDSGFVYSYSAKPVLPNGATIGAVTGGRCTLFPYVSGPDAHLNGPWDDTLAGGAVNFVEGNLLANRSSSTDKKFYSDTATSATVTAASTGLSSVEHYVLARNSGDIAFSYFRYSLRGAAIGQNLLDTEVGVFLSIMTSFQQALGRSFF